MRVIYDLDGLFQNLRNARDRLRKGIVPSDRVKKPVESVNARPQATARLVAHADTNPIRPANRGMCRSTDASLSAIAKTPV